MNKDKLKKRIGSELARSREEKGLSINKVAQALGMQWRQVNDMEKGNNNYAIDSLLRYCTFLEKGIEIS